MVLDNGKHSRIAIPILPRFVKSVATVQRNGKQTGVHLRKFQVQPQQKERHGEKTLSCSENRTGKTSEIQWHLWNSNLIVLKQAQLKKTHHLFPCPQCQNLLCTWLETLHNSKQILPKQHRIYITGGPANLKKHTRRKRWLQRYSHTFWPQYKRIIC